MGILVLNSGLYTTVQDLGRNGYQELGISPSGAMDRRSFKIANMLLDNHENEAVIEFTMLGPTLKFTSATIIAITGGNFEPSVNGKPVPMYTAIYVNKNDILEFHYAKSGSWGYIAFSSKLDIPVVMGSRSTNVKCSVGGFHGRKLKKGDQIWFRAKKRYLNSFLSRTLEADDFSSEKETIRVILGPQDDCFTRQGVETFLGEEYTVTSRSDRMGYRLDGPYIAHKESADIVSDGIAFGAVQVPNDGKPIVMLSDRPTTGGYTKIATVVSTDIPKLVQRKEGDKIRFETTSVERAQASYLSEHKEYDKMKNDIHKPCREILDPRLTAKRITRLFSTDMQEETDGHKRY